MKLSIKVPVKPYIKNFIVKYSGKEPIDLSARNSCLICDKMNDLLTRPQRYLYGKESPASLQKYEEKITFVLNSKQVHKYGFDLSPEKIIHFNNFVDKLIKDRLFILLDSMIALNPRTNTDQTIRNFLQEYDLEEAGLRFRTLVKSYQRYKEAEKPLLKVKVMAFKKNSSARASVAAVA